ncbi:hypothetical protein MSG28_011919 [Choristoneura fumiferana]|uniref:Uncharacterized protein n=1 Tax=Choristoneura fumiferana TaxID=7141 RepID=A0ACC0KN07_CHOFU|nr:hypothetical protein MSG28_011919 [Choristoneura fumiferana]
MTRKYITSSETYQATRLPLAWQLPGRSLQRRMVLLLILTTGIRMTNTSRHLVITMISTGQSLRSSHRRNKSRALLSTKIRYQQGKRQDVKPRQRFSAISQVFYTTELQKLDFGHPSVAAAQINAWVSNITRGKIHNLISEDDVKDSLVLLLTTLFFKGTWRHQFNPNVTNVASFYLSPSAYKQVPFMNVKNTFFYAESAKYDAKILRMPYLMGIRQAFEDTASFPGLARGQRLDQRLRVSKVLQKSGIEINELGKVSLVNKFGEDDEPPQEVIANKPFLFFIEDEATRQLLFTGRSEVFILAGLRTLDCQTNKKQENSRLNYFDTDLLKYSAEDRSGNVVVSPASIKSTLAMLLEGASGKTEAEIRTSLRVSPNKEEFREQLNTYLSALQFNTTGGKLQNANAVIVSKKLKLKKEYETMLQKVYLTEIAKLNFADPIVASTIINNWVSNKTMGLIPTLVEPVHILPTSDILLINALFFKNTWLHSFDRRLSHPACFRLRGICRNVAMMETQHELNYAFIDNLRAHAVELPYAISLLMEPTDVQLAMPRFTVDYSVDMVGPLRNMRITALFSAQSNLSGIFEGGTTQINHLFHKVHISVDEDGTVAAAATAAMVVPLIQGSVQLVVDRPFVFFIRDNNLGLVLFEGKIEEPNEFVQQNVVVGQAKKSVITNVPIKRSSGFNFNLLCLVGLCSARWVRRGRTQPKTTSFVGEATNELSTAIFQGYIDDNKNIAFSPLGYSAILAILAEGATGQTREQLVSALHLPDDQALTRKTFRYIMERLKNTHEYKYNQPELKNYFYIYKNYTINDDYKKILEDYYLTEVRSVERYNDADHFKPEDTDDKSELIIEINDKKAEESKKNEEIVDLVPPKQSDEKLISFAVEDKPEKVDISQIEYKPAKNIKEKIKLVKTYPKKEESGEEEETMVAVEARNHARSLRVLMDKNDIASTSPSNSLMIIFNGMYFRGAWKQPFEKVESAMFYTSNTEKKQVQMMSTKGIFRTGSLPGLDSSAIELPYDGGRYSLLVVVPRTRDGLIRLTADLPASPLEDIQDSLHEEELQFGVSSIFSREAELSGVSSAEGLFVQELVQHVAVRVDNADSSSSQLSASNTVQESLKNLPLSSIKPARRFNVDRPFIFFIIDRLDKLVVIAGKVTDPQLPMPFEI